MTPRSLAPLVVAVLASAAAAESPAVVHPNLRSDDRGFRLDFTLDACFPRLVGDGSVGGVTASVGDLGVNDSEVGFFGVARVSLDRWRVQLSGFTFETDGTGTAGGVALRSDVAWWEVSFDVGYEFWRPFAATPFPWSAPGEAKEGRVDLVLAGTLGVTYDDFSWDAESLGGGGGAGTAPDIDGGWLAVRAGAEFVLSVDVHDLVGFVRTIDIVAGGSVGPSFGASGDADGTGVLWTVDAGLHVRFSPNLGAHVGYRLVDNDFEYEGGDADLALRGLVAGLSLRF
jgi:hypothetical protein